MELKKLQDIISKYPGIDADSITEESSFKDMEVDSLDMAEITIEIEDTFDIVIGEIVFTKEFLCFLNNNINVFINGVVAFRHSFSRGFFRWHCCCRNLCSNLCSSLCICIPIFGKGCFLFCKYLFTIL